MSDQHVPLCVGGFSKICASKVCSRRRRRCICVRCATSRSFWVTRRIAQRLRSYSVQLDMKERGVGAPTFNNRLTVLSFFYATTCLRPEMKRHMRYQRAARKNPGGCRRGGSFTHSGGGTRTRARSYRPAFSVAYGGGLRASEVTHLKVGDIDSDRMLIRIEQGKGRKDRHVMLSPSLLDLLRDYYREAQPRGWMFRGPRPDRSDLDASVQPGFWGGMRLC